MVTQGKSEDRQVGERGWEDKKWRLKNMRKQGKKEKRKKGRCLGLKGLLNIGAYCKFSLSKENASIDLLLLFPRCR